MLETAAKARKEIPAKWVPESSELIDIDIPMDNRPGIIAEITAAAGKMGCNIQAIDIDHMTTDNAILRLALTVEGDIEGFTTTLEALGFEVRM
jgi:prephenate dehydrogenase